MKKYSASCRALHARNSSPISLRSARCWSPAMSGYNHGSLKLEPEVIASQLGGGSQSIQAPPITAGVTCPSSLTTTYGAMSARPPWVQARPVYAPLGVAARSCPQSSFCARRALDSKPLTSSTLLGTAVSESRPQKLVESMSPSESSSIR